MIEIIINSVKEKASEAHAVFSRKILAANNGYGKDDIIIGCRIPDLRKIAKQHYTFIHLKEVMQLLRSEIHEIRLAAIMIMVFKFNTSDAVLKKELVDMYLHNTRYINNWDLVDLSCYKIIGSYFKESDDIFWDLAQSELLWDNRIAIVSTYAFIKKHSFDLTLKLAEYFLAHDHHLIHKACGWMLREIGKKNETVLINFLREHSKNMPSIMLSYAKERIKNVQI